MPQVKALITRTQRTAELEPIFADIPPEVDWRFIAPGEALADAVADIEVLYGNIFVEDLPHAKQLRWVQSQQTGVDAMIYPEFVASDIQLTSLGAALSSTVAEHAVALLLAILRRLPQQRDLMVEPKWKAVMPVELPGLTVGILGLGRIGRNIAKRLAPFECRLLAFDPYPGERPAEVERIYSGNELPAFLGACDAVVVTVPSSPTTVGLVDAAAIDAMKDGSYLVNISRGDVVEPRPLLAALRSGKLAGCGLDVTEPEPLPVDDPLWREPNLLITPHTAGFSQNVHTRKIRWFVGNLRRYLKGEPLAGLVDKHHGW